MIRRSTAIGLAAILLSLMVHFLGLSVAPRGHQGPSAGDAATDVVALENTFEDVAALSEPVLPEPAEIPDPPVETPPEPEPADRPTSEALVASADPQRVASPDTGSARIPQPRTAGSAGVGAGNIPEPDIIEPSGEEEQPFTGAAPEPPAGTDRVAEIPKGNPDAATTPEEVTALASDPAPGVAQAPQQQVAVPVLPITPTPEPVSDPAISAAVEAVEPVETETQVEPVPSDADTDPGSEGSDLAVAVSPRPRLPDRRPPAEPQGLRDSPTDLSLLQVPPAQLIESPLTAYQRSLASRNSPQGGAARSGGLGFVDTRGPGNSDVTNYVGRVLVHLNRAPPVHVSAFGSARVFFEINPDGSLAWVDIIDSTGSREVERAAKAQVRKAAPFPRPPQGNSRRLTFVYRIN